MSMLLTCAELTISCVAQARHNVSPLVESLVDGSDVNGDVGMHILHGFDALRCGDQTDELDLLDAPLLEDLCRCRGRSSGCQHGIQDQEDENARLERQLVVILHGAKRML